MCSLSALDGFLLFGVGDVIAFTGTAVVECRAKSVSVFLGIVWNLRLGSSNTLGSKCRLGLLVVDE